MRELELNTRTPLQARRRRYRFLLLEVLSLGCALVPMAGCIRNRTIMSSEKYTLHAETELAVLAPPVFGRDSGDFQTATVVLGEQRTKPRKAGPLTCSISGDVFSLSPSSSIPGTWEVKSPSLHGWQVTASQIDVTAEWRAFVDKLPLLQRWQCFEPGLDVYAIQRAIVRAIPFPAEQTLLFAYSFGNTGFVDLEPGLRIKVERSATNGKRSPSVQFDVVAAPGTGVHLKLSGWRLLRPLDMDSDLSRAAQVFETTPFLRLFLQQGATDSQHAREPMLLGATNVQDLAALTQRISTEGTSACIAPSSSVKCVVFADGGISLLASIVINNRDRYYAPGTTLEQILDGLPDKDQGKALATVIVERPVGHGLYAPIQFPHSLESVRLLVLLSGDRVSWS